jgi:cobalamin biosynthesis protein CobD/CbiB
MRRGMHFCLGRAASVVRVAVVLPLTSLSSIEHCCFEATQKSNVVSSKQQLIQAVNRDS